MEIVQVGGKAKPLNGAFNILFDMRGRVCHGTVSAEDCEATLRGNCQLRREPTFPSTVALGTH